MAAVSAGGLAARLASGSDSCLTLVLLKCPPCLFPLKRLNFEWAKIRMSDSVWEGDYWLGSWWEKLLKTERGCVGVGKWWKEMTFRKSREGNCPSSASAWTWTAAPHSTKWAWIYSLTLERIRRGPEKSLKRKATRMMNVCGLAFAKAPANGNQNKDVCTVWTLTSRRAATVSLDREDSRVCLARKETKDPEDSRVYQDPSVCR